LTPAARVSSPVGSPATPARFTFRKAERLCSQKLLDGLFRHGTAFNTYPLRFVVWRTAAGTPVSGELGFVPRPGFSPQVVLSVSKRFFKRAHDRNRIKRLLREAWRHHKLSLENEQPSTTDSVPSAAAGSLLLLGVLYIGREKPESLAFLSRRLQKGLARIRAELLASSIPSRS
jgi:ribonuclease P protein component